MPVHAWVGTLISLIQGSVGVKPTKNTPHLLPLGTPYLKGIGSLMSLFRFSNSYVEKISTIFIKFLS
ncbi:hypothetical protein MXB_2688 [Myxobolus squamalis]|nr:hypothetical protein MXB_2688 [Myxobolus squamalis]